MKNKKLPEDLPLKEKDFDLFESQCHELVFNNRRKKKKRKKMEIIKLRGSRVEPGKKKRNGFVKKINTVRKKGYQNCYDLNMVI